MKNRDILLAKRRAILALFERHGAALKLSVTLNPHTHVVSFEVAFPGKDTREHFRRLDAIGRALQKLGLKIDQHANGFLVACTRHSLGLEAGNELVMAIVRRFRDYFDFWQIKTPDGFRMVDEAERPKLAKRLKYEHFEIHAGSVVVDGLESRAPHLTVSNAFADLYPNGSDEDLRDLFGLVAEADRGPVRASKGSAKKLAAATDAVAEERLVFGFEKAKDLHLRSNLFGTPYATKGETWPVNPSTQTPLTFVCQITEPRVLPKGIACVQIFYDFENIAFSDEDPGVLVKHYKALDRYVPIAAPESEHGGKAIVFTKDASLPGFGDLLFIYDANAACKKLVAVCQEIDRRADRDVYERERKRRMKHRDAWSFAGGFPRGVQDPPPKKGFLFQLGSDRHLEWPGAGAVYVHYVKKRFTFVLQTT